MAQAETFFHKYNFRVSNSLHFSWLASASVSLDSSQEVSPMGSGLTPQELPQCHHLPRTIPFFSVSSQATLGHRNSAPDCWCSFRLYWPPPGWGLTLTSDLSQTLSSTNVCLEASSLLSTTSCLPLAQLGSASLPLCFPLLELFWPPGFHPHRFDSKSVHPSVRTQTIKGLANSRISKQPHSWPRNTAPSELQTPVPSVPCSRNDSPRKNPCNLFCSWVLLSPSLPSSQHLLPPRLPLCDWTSICMTESQSLILFFLH